MKDVKYYFCIYGYLKPLAVPGMKKQYDWSLTGIFT